MSDLQGRTRQVTTMAKLLLFCYAVVFGPYLTRETYLAWAPLIYELAWHQEFPELTYEEPPMGTYDLVSKRYKPLSFNLFSSDRWSTTCAH